MMTTLPRFKEWPIMVMVLLLFAAAVKLLAETPLLVDEQDNYMQIRNFMAGDYHILEISALPGYHILMAFIMKIFQTESIHAARIITTVLSILAPLTFLLAARAAKSDTPAIKTMQFVLLPILFVFFPLLYTDVLSLTLVLCMLYLTLNKSYNAAGLVGILSMLVRQNNVLWIVFMIVIVYVQLFGWTLTLPQLKNTLKKCGTYISGIALFVLFLIINGGVAVGDADKHPAFFFTTGNIFYLLFCAGILLLPLHIYNIKSVYLKLKGDKYAWIIVGVVSALFWLTFHPDHPYNQIETQYYIRNLILVKTSGSFLYKIIFFAVILYTSLSLAVTPFKHKWQYLLYPFTILFITPSWLIEQRYYLIPFALFFLFRKSTVNWVEYSIICYFTVILYLLLPMISSVKLFL